MIWRLVPSNFYSWRGRINRFQFLISCAAVWLASGVVWALLLLAFNEVDAPPFIVFIALSLLSLVFVLPMFCLIVQRTHDLGWSGWIPLGLLVLQLTVVLAVFDVASAALGGVLAKVVSDFGLTPDGILPVAVAAGLGWMILMGCLLLAPGQDYENQHGLPPYTRLTR